MKDFLVMRNLVTALLFTATLSLRLQTKSLSKRLLIEKVTASTITHPYSSPVQAAVIEEITERVHFGRMNELLLKETDQYFLTNQIRAFTNVRTQDVGMV